MERIDLFDRYIKNQLSEKELSDFNDKLKSDKTFAEEFKIYLLCVDGIIKEAEQDDIEFGHAMKSISKAELINIIGKRVYIPSLQDNSGSEKVVARAFIVPSGKEFEEHEEAEIPESSSKRPFRIKNWVWQLAVCVAVVGLAILYVAEMERTARHNADNAIYYGIYAYNDGNSFSRGAGITQQDISSMSDKELESKLSEIRRQYESSIDDEEIVGNGTLLVMTYVKLHDRQEAINLLNELISKYKGNEYFEDDVNNWTTILTLLKQ